jgi:hypothetical protein
VPRRSYSQFIPSLVIKTDKALCSGPGSCGGLWVKYTGKYSNLYRFVRVALTHQPSLISALTLWEHDNSLTIALDVCNAFFEPIEYLITYFPGPGSCPLIPYSLLSLAASAYLCVPAQQRRLGELRARVLAAEAASGYIPTPIRML